MNHKRQHVPDGKSTVSRNPAPAQKARKTYGTPVLEEYGDLGALTLSVGAGSGDGAGGASSMTCWIAEALYGVDDHRTHLLRKWLNTVYSRTLVGSVVMAMYRAFGVRIAGWTRRSAMLRRILAVPFDAGVAAALRHYTLAAR